MNNIIKKDSKRVGKQPDLSLGSHGRVVNLGVSTLITPALNDLILEVVIWDTLVNYDIFSGDTWSKLQRSFELCG